MQDLLDLLCNLIQFDFGFNRGAMKKSQYGILKEFLEPPDNSEFQQSSLKVINALLVFQFHPETGCFYF